MSSAADISPSRKKAKMNSEAVSPEDPVDDCSRKDYKVQSNGAVNDENSVAISSVRKRLDYLQWDEYFMALAFLSAKRSKDPSTQVGACIVNHSNKIIGIGYNGMPNGCHDDIMPWDKKADSWLNTKYPYVCHAELNAILNKNTADVQNCRIYVTLFPCNECSKLIIQSGLKEVIFYSDKKHNEEVMKASRRLLSTADVKFKQFIPRMKTITIDFESINRKLQPSKE